MNIKMWALFLAPLIIKASFAQSSLPVIRANSVKASVNEDGKLKKDAWVISPSEKLDIYPTSARTVTFYTDIDSIRFVIDPGVSVYNFIILLNGKDSAHTQIRYDSAYKAPQGPTAEQVRSFIENQVYSFKIPPENIYKVVNRVVLNGPASIPIRIYYPNTAKNNRIIFNIHGGAFVACNLETHDNICRILANRTGSIVIALDYRKAPENPYPASIDDCSAVWQWIRKNARGLGGDPANMYLVGDSGGGLFAAELPIRFQKGLNARGLILINPAVDLRGYEQGSDALVAGWFLNHHDPADSLVSPMTAGSFSAFPRTLIVTSEKDDLKPQELAFFDRLKGDGVKAQTIDLPNKGHLGGYWSAGHPDANQAIAAAVEFIISDKP